MSVHTAIQKAAGMEIQKAYLTRDGIQCGDLDPLSTSPRLNFVLWKILAMKKLTQMDPTVCNEVFS